MSHSLSSARPGSALSKLLTVLCGLALFVVMACLLAVWALGRFSPKLLDATLASQSGAHLAIETNETNLFVGRLAYAGLTMTNPSRWQQPDFLRIRRVAIDFEPGTFLSGSPQTVNDVDLDIEHLTIIGKGDFLSDNNAKDIFNSLQSAAVAKPNSAGLAPPSPPSPFLIKRLRLRVDRLTLISGDGTPARQVVLDQSYGLIFEARDITELNFEEKVSRPLGAQVAAVALRRQPELLLDFARERLRKTFTEK